MTDNCRKFLENPESTDGIGWQQWSLTRIEIAAAIETVSNAIRALSGQ